LQQDGNAHAVVPPILSDHTLREHLFIDDGWLVLWGAHHRYLRPDPWFPPAERPQNDDDALLDLSGPAREGRLNWHALQENLQSGRNLYLYLKINCAVAPEAILKKLRPLLQSRHQRITVNSGEPNIDPETGIHTFPFHLRKDPPITDVGTWMKYFQCYDRRQYQKQTFEVIACEVYGASEAPSTAARAVRRVKELIDAAEQNHWPPPPPR
jgi:hypothetical protein